MFAAGRRGDRSRIEDETCSVCKKPAIGPAVTGSENVLINSRPAVRVHDQGEHAAGCGKGAWEAQEGAPAVLVNQRNAHRRGDGAKHCCGKGALMEGSPNVLIGNRVKGGAPGKPGGEAHGYEGGFHLVDDDGEPLVDVAYVIRTASGEEFPGRTNGRGHTKLVYTARPEVLEIEILGEPECGG